MKLKTGLITILTVLTLTSGLAAQTVAPAYIEFPFVQETGKSYTASRSQLLFQSTVIEQLRQHGVHVHNFGVRRIRPSQDIAGEQLIFNTRTFGQKSLAGLEIKVIAWPTQAQALSHATSVGYNNNNNTTTHKNIVQTGLFTSEFKPLLDNKEGIAQTQLAAQQAMSVFAPRSFIENPDEAIWRWNFVNTESNNQASKLRAFIRDFQTSPHRADAELALVSLPRHRGAVLVNPSSECTTRLHGAMRYLGNLSKNTTLPDGLFITTDTFELGSNANGTSEVPDLLRKAWDLSLDSAISNDVSQPKDKCALRERWGNERNILNPCTCSPLASK